MEIHFFTGKGGVGKSVLAAAKAADLTSKGRKVLLVELGDQSYFRYFFHLSGVEYTPTPIRDWFDLARWSGKEAFREYARHLLKVETIFRLIFDNPVTISLVDAAPGLAELSIMGKATSGPPRNVGPKMPYDAIVVDGYASGHFYSLLKAPFALSETVSVGPMGEQTRGIIQVLKESNISKYYVVTQSEELMVTETVELVANLMGLLQVEPFILLNKTIEGQLGKMESLRGRFGQDLERLLKMEASATQKLKTLGSLHRIPWVLKTQPIEVARTLAQSGGLP